ncbi:hypothetical protein P7C73_g5845, partial [Tremellales sp. Uapishka_1]
MAFSYTIPSSSTSLTLPSILGSQFPPVPEHEEVHPGQVRTISSRAEAQSLVRQNELDILELAQLPPSLDSSRSLSAQLAAYGESHAIEREFARAEEGGSESESTSFFSASSGSSKRSGSSKAQSSKLNNVTTNPMILVDAPTPSSATPSALLIRRVSTPPLVDAVLARLPVSLGPLTGAIPASAPFLPHHHDGLVRARPPSKHLAAHALCLVSAHSATPALPKTLVDHVVVVLLLFVQVPAVNVLPLPGAAEPVPGGPGPDRRCHAGAVSGPGDAQRVENASAFAQRGEGRVGRVGSGDQAADAY